VTDVRIDLNATAKGEGQHLECLFYSEAEAADRLGIHRTTLRTLALEGRAPVEPIRLTAHRRVYRRIDIHRLAGLES
jgi:hypothetical protein